MKDTWIAFCLLFGLCLHCASQRPHVPWESQDSRQSKSHDLNKDGIPDVFYVREKDKACSEEGVDWNGDGIWEVRRYFEHGQLVLESYDLNFEGKPSLWLHFHQGKLAFKAWDEDGDGEADSHAFLLQQSLFDFLELLLGFFIVQANASTPPPPPCCQTL